MDPEKRQGPAGPEKKPVSERKRTANRRNAQKSTGPTTPEGKARSKMNAVKHGLLAKERLITVGGLGEDPEAFEQLLADLREDRRPVGTLEQILVENIAGYVWRGRRAQRYEAGAIQREVEYQRDQEAARSQGRFLRALNSGESLEESVEGIEYLLAALERAIDEVQRGDWSTDSRTVIAQHLQDLVSLPPGPVRRPGGHGKHGGPDEFDPTQLLKDLNAQYDRLREHLPEVEASQKRQADARVTSYALPSATDLALLLRYDTPNDKKLHKTMDQLRKVQADRRKAEAASGDEGDDQTAA